MVFRPIRWSIWRRAARGCKAAGRQAGWRCAGRPRTVWNIWMGAVGAARTPRPFAWQLGATLLQGHIETNILMDSRLRHGRALLALMGTSTLPVPRLRHVPSRSI